MTTVGTPRPNEGQIMAIFAGSAIVLVIVLGLVIDGGSVFAQRRQGQNTADLQSLAGTKVIKDKYATANNLINSSQVFKALTDAATGNDCVAGGGTPCTWTARYVGPSFADLGLVTNTSAGIPNTTIGVKVGVRRVPATYILGIVGRETWTVDTTATAIVTKATSAPAGQLLPIALYGKDASGNDRTFTEGQVYDITDGEMVPGSKGFISWTGSNKTKDLESSICTPNNPAFTLPATFPAEPGNHNSSGVRDCLQSWVDSKATVLLPIYSQEIGRGNGGQYTVTGLAAFVLTSIDNPAAGSLQGYFVGIYPVTSIPAGGAALPPGPTDSVAFLGLVK